MMTSRPVSIRQLSAEFIEEIRGLKTRVASWGKMGHVIRRRHYSVPFLGKTEQGFKKRKTRNLLDLLEPVVEKCIQVI